jgi:hypothetical protein
MADPKKHERRPKPPSGTVNIVTRSTRGVQENNPARNWLRYAIALMRAARRLL